MDVCSCEEPFPGQAIIPDDRLTDLLAYRDTKAGVKGLVDSGTQTVPEIFIRPPEERNDHLNYAQSDLQVPVIDLSGLQSDHQRKNIVSEVGQASREWGFFQIVNHGIPVDILDGMLEGIRRFHEQDTEKKKEFYSPDRMQKVKFGSNANNYRSPAANWRDSLTVLLTVFDHIEPHELPEVCRDSMLNYINHFTKLGNTLFELLSEALGLNPDHLGALECAKGRVFLGHYYPPCPEPELTLGTSKHSDPSFLTILLQDQLGGLQVLHNNCYMDVQPVPGSFIVNIGDMLQILTNDEFISADHRVLTNKKGPRISVAGFFTGDSESGRIYAPMKGRGPARYKEFTVKGYVAKFFQRVIGNSVLNEFELPKK